MRTIRSLLLLAAMVAGGVSSSTSVLFAQQPQITDSTPGKRDASAIELVQKSLAALGGTNAIVAVRSVETIGQIQKNGTKDPMLFRWMVAVSGSHFEFRRETTVDGKTRVFASGHGKPGFGFAVSSGLRLNTHVAVAAIPLELPAILLYAELQDPIYTFTSIASPGSDQPLHIRITNENDIVLKTILEQDWYFDPQTALPIRVEHNIPTEKNALDTSRSAYGYSSYTPVEGVMYPTHIQAFRRGRESSQITISSTQPNTSVDSSKFDIQFATPNSGRAR